MLSSGYRLEDYSGILTVSQSDVPTRPCGEIKARYIDADDAHEKPPPPRFDIGVKLPPSAFLPVYHAAQNGRLPSEIILEVPAIEHDPDPAARALTKVWDITVCAAAEVTEASLIISLATNRGQ